MFKYAIIFALIVFQISNPASAKRGHHSHHSTSQNYSTTENNSSSDNDSNNYVRHTNTVNRNGNGSRCQQTYNEAQILHKKLQNTYVNQYSQAEVNEYNQQVNKLNSMVNWYNANCSQNESR